MRTLLLLVCGALITLALARLSLGAEAGSEVRQKQIERLREFSAQKAKQTESLARGHKIDADSKALLAAAERGNARAVTNLLEKLPKLPAQGANSPFFSYRHPLVEISLGYGEVIDGAPQHVELAIIELFQSIPDRCIYFGGTDSGRGLATAFSTDHAAGKPFLTLTQNQLADRTYVDYLRAMYGSRMRIPEQDEVDRAFREYVEDVSERMKAGKLKAGEDVKMVEGQISIQGQVAVMEVNARIAKMIFEANKNREFYVEESFALDWMYPYLSPHMLVMKLNAKPLETIGDEEIRKDYGYWSQHTRRFLGEWLTEKTGSAEICAFVKKVYGRRDFSGFAGDRSFIETGSASRNFGKWRGSMAGVYGWRAMEATAKDDAESARMQRAAEAAFAQAFAMAPSNPETVYRYVNLVAFAGRMEEAILIAETAVELSPQNEYFRSVLKSLRDAAGREPKAGGRVVL